MKTNLSLLFYLKKPKNYQKGPVPIYLRITVNSRRVEMATGRECEPMRWNGGSGKVIGTNEAVKSVNTCLSQLEHKILNITGEFERIGSIISAESIKEALIGKKQKARMLMDVIGEHNKRMESLVGHEYAHGTLKRYKVLNSHTLAFLKAYIKSTDIDVQKIDFAFVTDYEFYLRSDRGMNNNSVVKHLKMFRKILTFCKNNGWLDTDPFANFKGRYKKVDKAILTESELEILRAKDFASERLDQVRDTFLFCCYTGLAYSDVLKLRRDQINEGIDGEKWVFTQRQKTNVASNIPLLPEAYRIIEKYENHPHSLVKQVILPVPSNQKMNDYLKEIAVVCGINKILTSHVARHTFATTVTLQNGVPIESVSKMLGHTNIRTTQIYARILDIKVSEDMLKLRDRLKKARTSTDER